MLGAWTLQGSTSLSCESLGGWSYFLWSNISHHTPFHCHIPHVTARAGRAALGILETLAHIAPEMIMSLPLHFPIRVWALLTEEPTSRQQVAPLIRRSRIKLQHPGKTPVSVTCAYCWDPGKFVSHLKSQILSNIMCAWMACWNMG